MTRAGAMPVRSAVSAGLAGETRRSVRCSRVGDVGAVEDLRHPGSQHRLGGECALVLGAGREVERWVVEHLERDPRTALLEGLARHGRGEAAAGALPADREPVAVPALLGAVRGDPSDHLERLVGRRRERVLGRDDVVDVDHRHPCLGREVAAQRVVALGQRQDVAAAVEVDVDRRGAVVSPAGRPRRLPVPTEVGIVSSRVVRGSSGKRAWAAAVARRAPRPTARCIALAASGRHPRVAADSDIRSSSLSGRVSEQRRRSRLPVPGDPRDAGRDRASVGSSGRR